MASTRKCQRFRSCQRIRSFKRYRVKLWSTNEWSERDIGDMAKAVLLSGMRVMNFRLSDELAARLQVLIVGERCRVAVLLLGDGWRLAACARAAGISPGAGEQRVRRWRRSKAHGDSAFNPLTRTGGSF